MKNPNGYGSVAKLSGNRRRPYVVKKTIGWTETGSPIAQIIGYAATREEGNILLAEYNRNPWDVDLERLTLSELYAMWAKRKAPLLGDSNRKALSAAYNHVAPGCGRLQYTAIRAHQMQDTIDSCQLSVSVKSQVKSLWVHLDRYALELGLRVQRYSSLLTVPAAPETSRTPFTAEEVHRLWEHADTPWADTALILLYSGWRISELLGLRPEDVDTVEWTMVGGVKTAAGKNRIVPVHTRIRPLVQRRLDDGGERLIMSARGKPMSRELYWHAWHDLMDALGMSHVTHECRHTFESALDAAGANRRCIDLLMGHTSKDVGNRVYNHKTIEQLREAIELLDY